jgi:hypothetical protein
MMHGQQNIVSRGVPSTDIGMINMQLAIIPLISQYIFVSLHVGIELILPNDG